LDTPNANPLTFFAGTPAALNSAVVKFEYPSQTPLLECSVPSAEEST